MGCGGSKQEVATGNTVSHRQLLRKKSETSKSKTQQSTTPETDVVGNPSGDDSKADLAEAVGPPVADVKDITVNAEGDAAEEGKLVFRDSPDRYFSSRKDEEFVDAVIKHAEDGTRDTNTKAGSGSPAESKDSQKGDGAEEGKGDDAAVVEKGTDEAATTEENGKLVSTMPGDLKEPILVQETKGDDVVEMKNLRDGETLDDSLAH